MLEKMIRSQTVKQEQQLESFLARHDAANPFPEDVLLTADADYMGDGRPCHRMDIFRPRKAKEALPVLVNIHGGGFLLGKKEVNRLFCADCGSVMYQQRYQTDKRKQDCYICGNYKKRTHDCTAHFIRTDLLTAGVLSNLRKVTSYAAKHEARFMKLLIEQNEDGGKRRNAAKKKELEAAEKRIAELSAIFKRLYEDSVTGRISDERFTELSADYEAEQRELKERAAALLPIWPLSRKKSGTPMSAPPPKHRICRFVKLNMTLVFTAFKSLGTGTYAKFHHLRQ